MRMPGYHGVAAASLLCVSAVLGLGRVAPVMGGTLPDSRSAHHGTVSLPAGSPDSASAIIAFLDGHIKSSSAVYGGPLLAATRFDEFADEDRDKVSVSRAALLSLVLPGAGQWYAGSRGRAAAFLAADGVIWAAFGYFETVGAVKRNDYHTYARVHAGIDPTGKDDAFYKTITFYDSRDEYNGLARVFDPRRPYYPDTPYWHWQWDSDASRSRYRSILNQSNEAFNRGKFSLAALAINRLVAALDAIRFARSVNRRARMETTGWKIHFRGNPVFSSSDFAVSLSRNF